MKSILSVTIAVLFTASIAFADSKTSALPVATSVNTPDYTMVVQGGVNKKADVTLFGAATPAAAILAKLLTVDGTGSGLDADYLQGLHANAFATAAQGAKADAAQPAATAITTSNIASQSVNYANSAGAASSASTVPWSGISGKPTTASGYGITDAITAGNIGSQSVSYAASAGSVGGIAQTAFLTAADASSKLVYGTHVVSTLSPDPSPVSLGSTIRNVVCSTTTGIVGGVICSWSGSTLTISFYDFPIEGQTATIAYQAVVAR